MLVPSRVATPGLNRRFHPAAYGGGVDEDGDGDNGTACDGCEGAVVKLMSV